jgi:hypothetical protein
MARLIDFLIKLDQIVFQIITLGVAKRNETISAAAYNAYITGRPWGYRGWAYRTIDALFSLLGQRDHCRDAWLWQASLYKDQA